MKIYLAGDGFDQIWVNNDFFNFNRLKSYHYIKNDKLDYIHRYDSFMLDSGAYSTFKNPSDAKKINWDNYVEKYILFIKKNNIKHFFELDIDAIVGLNKVEYYRKKMEDNIGRSPIVVWHSDRGWDYFCKMCEMYRYVALGTTLANKQGRLIRKNPMILDKFIQQAHKSGSKIHGLGFTSLKYLDQLRFDSVDSTSWLGARFGLIYHFNGKTMNQIKKPNGSRLKTNESMRHNFRQWILYSKYAEANL